MFARIILITVCLFAILINPQELLAQQKAPLDDSGIAALDMDIDEPVNFELNMEPDTPAAPIVISIETQSTPRMVPSKAVETRVIAVNADQPFMHLRMLSEEGLDSLKKK